MSNVSYWRIALRVGHIESMLSAANASGIPNSTARVSRIDVADELTANGSPPLPSFPEDCDCAEGAADVVLELDDEGANGAPSCEDVVDVVDVVGVRVV